MTASPATRSVLLTPPGTGAIAVVRVVGAHADEIISKAFRPTDGDHASGQAGRIHYGTLNRGEEVLDDVLVCRLAGQPEPVWEVCSHGGVRVVQRIIEVFSALGAPLDTAAASRADGAPNRGAIEKDALAALARVQTVAGLQFLAWQRAHLEDALRGLAERWTTDSGGVLAELRQMIARARQARVLLNGADVAIIGPPNAGKSTLLNRLLGRAAAVVSSTPGTTRDWVGAEIEIQGVPFRLIDTAGRRVSEASIECEAIQRGVAATREADLSLVVLDATCAPDTDYMDELCVQISPGRAIVVINKMDLVRQDTKNVAQGVAPLPGASPDADGRGTLRPEANQAGGLAAEQPPALRDGSQSDLRGWAQAAGATLVSISAKTGSGVAALGDAMVGALGVDGNLVGLPAFFCDRQVAMAQRCVGGDDPPLGDRAEMIRRLIIGL